MKYFTFFALSLLGIANCIAQSLGRVGNPVDIITTPTAGTVLMGGGSDVDAAFSWMINKSGGGDFVIIRATGTNAYNSYVYALGAANSVETFLVNSIALANDSGIVQSIRKAEAVFFAGGDQNDYISNYKGTALGATIDYLANVKHAPIGGTSAGMAIQGYIYYDGVTNVQSEQVLQNPYASGDGIHYNDFLQNPFLTNTICDTHFNTKGGTTSNGITGRQGRVMSFLSRMIKDSALTDVKAIACEEKTAVCIDENGIAMVVGINKAYFIRQWCSIPETIVAGTSLTWTNGTKVYIISGPGNYTSLPSAVKSVNLNDWATVAGGTYNYWTVNNGVLTIGQTTGTPATCLLLPLNFISFTGTRIDNTVILKWQTANEINTDKFIIERATGNNDFIQIGIVKSNSTNENSYTFNDNTENAGTKTVYYRLKQMDRDGRFTYSKIVSVKEYSTTKAEIFPNPVTSSATIQLQLQHAERVALKIISVDGKVLSTKTYGLKTGNNLISLNTEQLTSGVYVVVIAGQATNQHLSFSKQ